MDKQHETLLRDTFDAISGYDNKALQFFPESAKHLAACLGLKGDERWDVVWNAGFRRMVGQLSPSDQKRFRQEHMQEVAALATREGIRLDVGVLFIIGTKP